MTYRETEHASYRNHRRQVWTQILLPAILAVVLILAAIVAASLATFRGVGDSGRWAAIATVWLTMPVLITGLLVIAALAALVFGMGKVVGLIPRYSFRAQMLTRRVEFAVKQGGEMIRRPQLAVRALANRVRGRASGNSERMGKR